LLSQAREKRTPYALIATRQSALQTTYLLHAGKAAPVSLERFS